MNGALYAYFPLGVSLILLFFSTRKFAAHDSKENFIWLLLFAAFPIFAYGLYFIGFRPLNAGLDTPLYIRAYEQLDKILEAHQDGMIWYGNTEILWWPLQAAIKIFFDSRGWLVVNYLLVFFFIFFSYRRISPHYGISVWIFPFVFLTYYFVYAGNTIRQALALPVALLGFSYYFEKRRLVWFFVTMVAVGLHWSCVVFLVSPVFSLKIFKQRWFVITLPTVALLLSLFVKEIVASFLSVVGLEALISREELYFSGLRESHIGEVWQTLNFWICVLSAAIFLFSCPPKDYKTNMAQCYVVLFLSLILFGMPVADFSERYMPAVLLFLPLMAAMVLDRVSKNGKAKSFLFVTLFLLMGLGVVLNKSAQLTLGY